MTKDRGRAWELEEKSSSDCVKCRWVVGWILSFVDGRGRLPNAGLHFHWDKAVVLQLEGIKGLLRWDWHWQVGIIETE